MGIWYKYLHLLTIKVFHVMDIARLCIFHFIFKLTFVIIFYIYVLLSGFHTIIFNFNFMICLYIVCVDIYCLAMYACHSYVTSPFAYNRVWLDFRLFRALRVLPLCLSTLSLGCNPTHRITISDHTKFWNMFHMFQTSLQAVSSSCLLWYTVSEWSTRHSVHVRSRDDHVTISAEEYSWALIGGWQRGLASYQPCLHTIGLTSITCPQNQQWRWQARKSRRTPVRSCVCHNFYRFLYKAQ